MQKKASDLRHDVKMTCLGKLVPTGHLLRKIERTIDFSKIYSIVEHLYCEDNGRPAVDPVVRIKMVLIRHLYGD